MVRASLILNVVVLVPVLWSLLAGSAGMGAAFGGDAPVRRILVAVYLAIALLSASCWWDRGAGA